MKRRTKVPASLVRDLKEFAWGNGDRRIAVEVLIFDPATAGDRTLLHLADTLVVIAKVLAKYEAHARRPPAQLCESWTTGDRRAPYATAEDVAADVMIHSDTLRKYRALQARIWRVIDGLMLEVRGGQMPRSMAWDGGAP